MIEFAGDVFRWAGGDDSAWYFVAVPPHYSDEVRDIQGPRRGFGSVRVRARIGGTHWTTSIFPSAAVGAYVLPLKKAVREAEGLADGDPVSVQLELVAA